MQYPEVIRIALDYIEQNLKTDITAEELAQMQIIRHTIIIVCFHL